MTDLKAPHMAHKRTILPTPYNIDSLTTKAVNNVFVVLIFIDISITINVVFISINRCI